MVEAENGELNACELVWWKRTTPEEQHRASMVIRLANNYTTQWQVEMTFPEEAHYIKYGFLLTDPEGNHVWLNAYGIHPTFAHGDCGQTPLQN